MVSIHWRNFYSEGAKAVTLIVDTACRHFILQEAITLASPAARIVLMGFSSDPCELYRVLPERAGYLFIAS